MSKGSSAKKAAAGIQAAGEQMYERGKMTPEEQAQYQRSFATGQDLENILRSLLGIGTAPGGYQDFTQQYLGAGGDLARTLYQQVLTEAQDPYAYYESTLQPQLQLTEDYINRQAQARGLLRSGLPIEQMGRAGAELAIREAAARQTARQNALQQAYSLSNTIYGQGQQNISNLASLYGQQQGWGLQGMQRQAGQAQQAGQYQAYPAMAQLGNIYGTQAGLMGLAGAGIGALGTMGASYFAKPPVTNIYSGYPYLAG